MPEQKFHTIKLLRKQMISRDIMELWFERPAGFRFNAGQFVRFEVPTPEGPVLRLYSISSTPSDDYLEFCAKIIPQGKASTWFSQLTESHEVKISSPQGVFVCRPEHAVSKMFVATGAGIAPIISMIEDRLQNSLGAIKLLFGIRTPADIFWQERLAKLQTQFPNFYFQLTVSRPDETWSGLSGRVTNHLKSSEFRVQSSELGTKNSELRTEYYICGSVEMVKDVRSLLLAKRVDTHHIHFEIF